jgi:hypothetical protein
MVRQRGAIQHKAVFTMTFFVMNRKSILYFVFGVQKHIFGHEWIGKFGSAFSNRNN